jgi:hypothetical protein
MTRRLGPIHRHGKPVAVVTSTIPTTIYTFDREIIRQVQSRDMTSVLSHRPVRSSTGSATRWAHAFVHCP